MNRGESWRIAGASLSLANLLTIGRWDVIQDVGFHYYRKLPDAWFLLRETLFSIFLCGVAILILGLAARRWQGRIPGKCGLFLLLGLLVIAADVVAGRSGRLGAYVFQWAWPIAMAGALLAAIAAFFLEARAWKVLQGALLFALPVLPVSVLWTGWLIVSFGGSSALADRAPAPLLTGKHANAPRVLWIVFDEFDYEIAFGHPPPELRLPELQRLRQTSLFAEQASSVGRRTEESIPGYFAGRRVEYSKPLGPANLMLRFEGTKAMVPWTNYSSVFSAARQLGFNSSVTGFFHPYCRVLPDLASCYWLPGSHAVDDTAEFQEQPARRWEATVRQLFPHSQILRWLGVIDDSSQARDDAERGRMIFLFQSLLSRSLRAAVNPSHQLVYVHLPAPHPPGYFDAGRNDFSMSDSATYIDNLALVDRTVGQFRHALEKAERWDATTVLITTDHALRPGKGRGPRVGFRPASDAPSKHVPFIVKLAGQTTGIDFAEPLNTVLTRELTLAILRGDIGDERALAAWISSHRH